MSGLIERLKGWPLWKKITVGALVFLVVVGIIGESSTEQKPATQAAEPSTKEKPKAENPEPTTSPQDLDLSAADVVDLSGGEARFCRSYATVLAAGLGEDVAFGNFLKGYGNAGSTFGVSGREVFDEYVSRC